MILAVKGPYSTDLINQILQNNLAENVNTGYSGENRTSTSRSILLQEIQVKLMLDVKNLHGHQIFLGANSLGIL